MMMNQIQNMKWRLPVYFFISICLTLAFYCICWLYFTGHDEFPQTGLRVSLFVSGFFIGPLVGYFAGLQFQRKLDNLHLAIKQAAKGNLSERIPIYGNDSFDDVSVDFNEMVASVESRIKLLQKLGEQTVMLQTQSNEDAVLEERKRLARDLHDTVSQALFAIHMSSSSLPKMLDTHPAAARIVVEQLVTMSQHAQKQMRSLIAQLRPLELEEQSLPEALENWFPDYCRQNGLQGKLDIRLEKELSEAMEHQFFLIIQEGMANVVKHARAAHVSLSLQDLGHQYVLAITDDGKGFNPRQQQPDSYGLSTMKERAQKMGGDAEILSRGGTGTSIKVNIPKFS